MTAVDEMHKAIRREVVAARSLNYWRKVYAEEPSDSAGANYHDAWIEMRAAVDALVLLPPVSAFDLEVALPDTTAPPTSFPERTQPK